MIFGFLRKFWIDIEKIYNKIMFSRPKHFVEKVGEIFFEIKKIGGNLWKNQWKTKIPTFRFFDFFSRNFGIFNFHWLFRRFFLRKKNCSKNKFSTFSRKFFDLEKFYFCMDFFLYQSEIFSGIQKSYLENRARILKLYKTKNPNILTQISGFPCSVTYTDPRM